MLRSPHAHARILSIDISRAEALPGVKGIVTANDLPTAEDKMTDLGEGAVSLKYLCDNILASDKALYRGHAIAAVAATSPHIAEEACQLIDVEYEVLTPVIEVRQAMETDAPLLHEDLKTSSLGETSEESSNVASHIQHKKGDIEKGFADADNRYRT